MSHTHTIDDIWKLFQETNRLFQESKREAELAAERRQQEAERRQQEAEQAALRRQQEAERRQQEAEQAAERRRKDFEREMEAKRADTERRIQEADRKLLESRQETDRKLLESRQETDRKLLESSQETDRKIKEVSALVGKLGGRLGEFVEGLVAPACKTLFLERGIPVSKVSHNVEAKLPGNRDMEIDLLVVNGDAVVLVEVKSKLHVNDTQEHLTRLAEFKEFFPEYADKRVMGAVAAMVVEESVGRHAINRGLFVLVQSGDTVRLANEEAFTPRTW